MLSDEELILAIGKGDDKAFRTIYDAHYKLLLGVAINLNKDIDVAKEVVQEVFYQLWKNKETVSSTIAIRNYLKRAVINRSINHLKYNARFVGDESLDQSASSTMAPDVELETNELRVIIEKAVNNLPEKARIIFILKRYEGLSLKEISDQLDISPKTVENQITRALKMLKTEIEPYLKKVNEI